MAVTQYFVVSFDAEAVKVDLVEETMTLSREAAETLCADLGEALHPEGVPSPENVTQDLLATFLASLQATQNAEPDIISPTLGRMMSPDEALARVQATAASQDVPTGPVRNPGTMIGNG